MKKKTYWIAVGIITVVVLWMASGVFKSHPADASTENQVNAGTGAAASIRVRTRHLLAERQRVEVVVRGRTEAKHVVDVKAETAGRVIAVPVEKGQQVKAGDVLCQLAVDDKQERLAQAEAAANKASIDYAGALKLKEKGLLSDSQIASSRAAQESARAALKSAQLDVEHLKMRAPFAGFVEDRPAQIGLLMERSAVCARLVDESVLLATGQVSERDVAGLSLGQPAQVRTSNGGQLTGRISFISQTADPSTRTYRIEAVLDVAGTRVRDGLTAQITIPLQEVEAHRITPAVLALDDAGKVGVRIVDEQRRVRFYHVQVVRESLEGVWVTGLPREIDLITVGQELVADGDAVEISEDLSGSNLPVASGVGQ